MTTNSVHTSLPLPARRISAYGSVRLTFKIISIVFPSTFAIAIVQALLDSKGGPIAAIMMLVSAIVSRYILKFFWTELYERAMDSVSWEGNELILSYEGRSDRVCLKDILGVNSLQNMRPERIQLTLYKPSLFGKEITFFPRFRFMVLGPHPIVAELHAAVQTN